MAETARRCQVGIAEGAMAGVAVFRHLRAMDLEELKQLFERTGKTQKGLAEALSTDPGVITRIMNGTREIKLREVPIIRAYFEGRPTQIVVAQGETLRSTNQLYAPSVNVEASGSWPRDVPIMGVTVGGADGDFLVNMGEEVDYAKRPPTIARATRIFALYVQGTSMSRWREPGQLVYVDPVRPAKPGDRVVVECEPENGGDGHPAYLKEFVTKTATKVRLKQYNPESVIEISLSKVRHIHRVIEWEELLGV